MSWTEDEADIRYVSALNRQRTLRWHSEGLDSWSMADWAVALAGEAGELCNVVKKLNRVRDGLRGNKETPEELQKELANEAADIYLYLDLFCQSQGIDLPTAIKSKFNEVSTKHNFPEKL